MSLLLTSLARFVKNNVAHIAPNACKEVGQLEKDCKSKNKIISSIKFDSCYLLPKRSNGVYARFIGTLIVDTKKKLFGCQTI